MILITIPLFVVFQSTPSGGKATRVASPLSRQQEWFQSTPSGGKATRNRFGVPVIKTVSIHAFRGEGDATR